jgi:hypothetical protein
MPVASVGSTRSTRREDRARLKGQVVCRRGPNRQVVELVDLSRTGVRIATMARLQPNERVWLKLPMLEPLEARIVWANGGEAGCEFLVPLHPAIFQVVSRAQAGTPPRGLENVSAGREPPKGELTWYDGIHRRCI